MPLELLPLLQESLRHHQVGHLKEAEAGYHRILQQWPDQPDALNLLGVMAHQAGQHEIAIDRISRAIAQLPNEPDFHGNLASAYQAVGRVTDAIVHYREAIRLNPKAVNQYLFLSDALLELGGFEEALSYSLQALRIDPNSALAYCTLGELAGHGCYSMTDEDIQRMAEILGREGLSPQDACLLHFTLAAHYERSGRYDQAFVCYERANERKQHVYRSAKQAFDRQKHLALIDGLIAAFTPQFLKASRTFGIDSQVPVFVVGMVRSGTTLVEQILASHPQVHGAGERKEIDKLSCNLQELLPGGDAYPACVRRLEPGLVRSLAYGYLQKLAREAGTASRIVDKMPHNYLHLGLISMLFPRARIVHCRRDPLDVCASAYFQNFKWMPHAASLDDIAFYHRQYMRLMDHWRTVLPIPIHEVVYEEIVAHSEKISRDLVAACGLDWDDRCLSFYRTERTVQTASKLQVRQPIYQRSVGRGKAFAVQLEPLRRALEMPQ